MSEFPRDLPGQIEWLVHEIAEIKRRDRNRHRTGKIIDIDYERGLARVEFQDRAGEKYIGPWMPWKEISSGDIKTHFPPATDEQVDVFSESGDLTDGVIDMSTPSNANPRPHSGSEAVIELGGSRIVIAAESVRITSPKIVLDGEVHLGGDGGKLLHRQGDEDTAGDAAVGSAARVFAV